MKWNLLQVILFFTIFFCGDCINGTAQAIENHTQITHPFTDHDHKRCGIDQAIDKQAALDPNFAREVREFLDQGVPQLSKISAGRSNAPVITIPVVVHIIHSGEDVGVGSNLAEGRIQAQIDILNEDFSATNPNYDDTPAQWQDAAGNPEIQFCLAIVDPDGNPTNGITRDNIPVTGPNAGDNNIDDEIKPAVWWDSDEYYNIYVVAIPGTTGGGGTTGWAFYPTNGVIGTSLDGSVVDYRWFGGPGWGQSGYKTLTHETGHYLGLPHTFDDESCVEDDGIDDTPNIDAPTADYMPGLSCNGSFPTGPTSCSNEHMYVNYMDYVNDDRCYTSFTNEQVNLMRSVLEGTAGGNGYGSRLPLTENATTVCSFFDIDAGISAIVEPAANQCGTGSITPVVTLKNFGANVLTTVTITYQIDGGTPIDFIWVDNLESGGTIDVNLDPYVPPAGDYLFTAYTQSPNGVMDEQLSNDTLSVEPTTIVPIDLPLLEDFEDMAFDPTVNGVFQFNPGGDDFTWQRSTEASGFGNGTASTVFNNFEGTGGNNPGGTFDALITQIYDFTDVTGAELTFDVAYAPFDETFFDSLKIFASTDCGVTYDQLLYSDGNTGLSTAPATTGQFTPSPNQWRTETIDLSNFNGFSNVSIAFINLSGWGNRLFLDNINISPPCGMVLTTTQTEITCNGFCDGTATVIAENGMEPLTYIWDANATNQTTATAVQLCSGTYSVTVTDDTGCSKITTVTFSEPESLNLTASSTDETFVDANDGTASAVAGGGTGILSYAWSNGTFTANIENLEPGDYTVTVTDENDCSISTTVTVNPYDCTGFGVEIGSENISCNGFNDGMASADPFGGTAPFNYLWSNGSEASTIQNLAAGTYGLTVTDNAGCTTTETIMITEPDELNATLDISHESTVDANDGTITVNLDGGTPGYIFQWIPAVSTTNTASDLEPGSYCVIITDANNCTLEVCGEVEPYLCDFQISVEHTTATCLGGGTAIVSTFGGTAPFSFDWSTGDTTQTVDDLNPGIYNVTVTDATNCELDMEFEIEEIDFIEVVVIGTNETSPGANDGTATANVSGGTGNYEYVWSNGGNTQIITNLEPGFYNVTVTDQETGCTTEEIVFIEEANPDCSMIAVQIATTGILCFGDQNGAATAFPGGGTEPYEYEWNTGGTTQNIDGLGEGIYIVTITDAEGCTAVAETALEEPAALEITMSSTNETSPGANDGTASADPSGGTPAYAYDWDNGGMSSTIDGLSAGVYTVTVTDQNGCSQINEVEVGQGMVNCDDFLVEIESTDASCHEGANGTAVALPMNGTGPYEYDWSTGESLPGITGLSTGFYTVTVIDVNGCEAVGDTFISEPEPIEIVISSTDATGPGNNDGTASAMASGGTGDLSYEWSNGATTASIMDLEPGIYTVIVTDENQCIATETVEIGIEGVDCSNFGVGIEIEPISCNGAEDGSAFAFTINGTPPYSFMWNTGAITQEITNLGPGFYSVIVTDANDCQEESFIQINEPAPLQLVANVSNESTPGANDGAIDLTVAGGVPGYTLIWSNGETSEDIDGLAEGTYTVMVTDENGCEEMITVNVGIGNNDCNDFTVSSSWEDVSCGGSNDGLAIVMAAGGTPPFSYNWSNGATTQAVSGLTAGLYTVIVIDANDCILEIEIEISEPEALGVSVSWTNETNLNANDGTANASPFGGTGDYQFAWSNGETTAEIDNLEPGIYTLTVTDDLGCTAEVEVEIEAGEDNCGDFEAVIVSTPVDCFGDENGTASVDPLTGLAPYEYTWNNGETGAFIGGLPAGVYTVTVIDANMCELILETAVESPSELAVNVTGFDGECGSGASALANPFGGTGPYEYLWNNGETDNFIGDLAAGVYTVTITDQNACSTIGETEVEVDSEGLSIESEVDDVSCFGENDGAIEITVVQGTPPFSFEWSNGATTEDLEEVSPGTYTLFVTDAAGCSFLTTFEISSPAELAVDIAWTPASGDANGTATAFAGGGTTPYNYQWSNGSNNVMIENLNAGIYFVTVTDANGCTVMNSVNVLMTGIAEIASLENIDIYPNPSSGELTILASFSTVEAVEIRVYNVIGQSLVSRSFEGTDLNLSLDLTDQPAGTYFLRMKTDNGIISRKLVLAR